MKLPVVFERYSWYLIVIAGFLAVSAVVGFGFWLHNQGYQNGVQETEERYQRIIDRERKRIKEANQAALEAARKREQDLRNRLEQLDEQIIDLQGEAAEDPNASRPSVSGDSVRRLNRVR